MENSELDLIINVGKQENRVALLDKGRLIDYQIENVDMEFSVGDIYLGEIRKKSSSLNSFFINLDSAKDGFMHFSDLTNRSLTASNFCKSILDGDNVKVSTFDIDPREKERIEFDETFSSDFFDVGDKMLVQVSKEAISTKGPRVVGRLSLAGKYLILVIFNDSICISKKITDQNKRNSMLSILTDIKKELGLDNFGIILRTSTDTMIDFNDVVKAKKILIEDLITLLKIWSNGLKKLRTAEVGTKIIGADSRVFTIVKNRLSSNLRSIYVDDEDLYNKLKLEFSTECKNKNCKLKLYKEGVVSLFAYKGVDKQLKLLSNKTVSIANGGYLIIEKTEAMNVIDVNSGSTSSETGDQEDLALQTNLAASKEIVRQIFLRDMGGIISIDFIDMKSQKNRMMIYEEMKELLSEDRSTSTVLPLSKFNVMQITRQRVRPVMEVLNKEECPTCHGSGKVEPIVQIVDIIENKIRYFLSKTKYYRVDIYLHPLLYSYFSLGTFSKRFRWGMKYWKSITLYIDYECPLDNFKIYNNETLIYPSED